MKCYVIYHIHIFEDGNEDYKIIGIFSSYDKALEVKEKYSSELPGFKDFPEEFCIEEFEVTGLDMAKQRTVYVIFTYIYKNGEEEELSVADPSRRPPGPYSRCPPKWRGRRTISN